MENRTGIRCNDLCAVDNEIWFSDSEMNGLYKKRTGREEAEFVAFFPNEKLWQDMLHGNIIRYENRLIFVPLRADNISVYDLEKGSFSSYKIDWTGELACEKAVFFYAALYGTYVYMFGYAQPCILKFDIESGKYNLVNGWFRQFQTFGYHKNREMFSERGIRIEEKLYLFTKQNNVLIEFNLSNEDFRYYIVGGDEDRFIAAEYNNGNFWLLNMQKEILEWNEERGVIKRIPIDADTNYYRSIQYKEYIAFLPSGNGTTAFCINSWTETVEWKSALEAPAQMLKEMFGGIFYCSNKNSTMYRLNEQGWDAAEHLFIDAFVYNSIIWNELKKERNGMVYEEHYWKLENFLEVVSGGK